MQRIHQGAALFFLAFSAFVVWESWNLEYYTHLGPGAGFFPLWLGVIMGGLSLDLAHPGLRTQGAARRRRLPSGA